MQDSAMQDSAKLNSAKPDLAKDSPTKDLPVKDSPRSQARLIQFLKDDLSVPTAAIALALRKQDYASDLLPMILWQYGLITTEQLDRVFDWMEAA